MWWIGREFRTACMDRFSTVLLAVWSEAGRHIEIRESAANIARLLAEHLPLAQLLVRRFDATHNAVETIAVGQVDHSAQPSMGKTILTGARFKRLIAWGREGTVLQSESGTKNGDLAMMVPAEVTSEVLAGALQGSEKPAGVLLLVAAHGKSFRSVHMQMVEALLEPFSAALENDRRLYELAALRQA